MQIDIPQMMKIELFQRTCWRGDLNEAKNMFEINKELFCKYILFQQLFTITCSSGHLDVVKWLFEIKQLFFASKSLPIYCDTTLTEILKQSFTNSCINGHLDVSKWLFAMVRSNNLHSHYLQYDIHTIFKKTCCNGKLKVAKWIWQLFGDLMDISLDDDEIAKIAVKKQHTKLFKWILSVYPNWDKIQNNKNLIAELYCWGNLSLLKWLQNNGFMKSVESCDYQHFLTWMKQKKHLFVMKYFFAEFNKSSNEASNDHWRKSFYWRILFWNCCVSKDGCFSTAKWVVRCKPTILKKNDYENHYESKDILFCNICHNEKYRILKWMLQLGYTKYLTSIVCEKNATKIQCKKFYNKKQQISKL